MNESMKIRIPNMIHNRFLLCNQFPTNNKVKQKFVDEKKIPKTLVNLSYLIIPPLFVTHLFNGCTLFSYLTAYLFHACTLLKYLVFVFSFF